jgi:hypothetical protein
MANFLSVRNVSFNETKYVFWAKIVMPKNIKKLVDNILNTSKYNKKNTML